MSELEYRREEGSTKFELFTNGQFGEEEGARLSRLVMEKLQVRLGGVTPTSEPEGHKTGDLPHSHITQQNRGSQR